MIHWYPNIKLLHVSCVLLSGSVFALRGSLMLMGSKLSQHRALKIASYLNDSMLLFSGISLMILTEQYPTQQPWLALKLSLLPIYILLGIFALRLGRTYGQRSLFLTAALLVYGYMLSIAYFHHPLGLWHVF